MARTLHLLISGRVQGVGFRDSLRSEALARGCTGWVRNRRDGSVEAIVQGKGAAVDAVIAWARRGPSAARVTGIDVDAAQIEHDRPYAKFDFLPTA
jgi:acylphosphatase